MAIIGIDLGTTNSLCAIWEDNKVKIIPNSLGKNLTPSVVSVDENGEILIGEIAKERLITYPESTASTFKRYIGTNKIYQLKNYKFTPEDLSSFILKSLKKDAEVFLGEEVTEAVISVPAYFNDSQRKATKRAGELAGLKVERLISEPTAAALAYGITDECEDSTFLVFDLGGGTFDVSILELFDGIMEVKAIAGDNYLGGEDFNEALVSQFLLETDLLITDFDSKSKASLYKQAEACKRTLTNKNTGKMNIHFNNKDYSIEVNPNKMEMLCKDLILKIRQPVAKALRDASITPFDLDGVILMGGSTRMPLIKSTVSKLFNLLPYSNINPDETVALGAAIQAALKERNKELKETILTDVCPYTLGVEIVKETSAGIEPGYFLPIIERNSPVPISKEVPISTIVDNQRKIRINIFQGESRVVTNNVNLGELIIDIPKKPRGFVLNLRYTYDINGLLEAEVTIPETGVKKSLVIENSPGSMNNEEINQRLKELEKIKIHPRNMDENRLIIERGERIYEESLGDTREYVATLLTKFEEALYTQDPIFIKKVYNYVKDEFDNLENYYI
ncbi:molecular chaperone HscC [Clostridium sporogenes]|uniref:molecular chaperone HscC n=1 Tax=Clostridium sporogenes TaxID=1509 RepID=UPI002903AB94|nr:molecular chaperone HscC [Clostridium botulinum]